MKTENMIAFINDVMVLTKIEEKYNDIVEEILKRITENNLFVKSEKFM